MDKNQIEALIRVAKSELGKLSNETIRPNQGFKIRTHGVIIASIIDIIKYNEELLSKMDKPVVKTIEKKEIK